MKRFAAQCLAMLCVFATFPVFATSSESADVRKELCGYLPEGKRCEESTRLFGQPPSGTMVNDLKWEYCKQKSCRLITEKEIVSALDLPRGDSIQFHQTLTVISKNGIKKSWTVEDGYGFEGEMKASPYEIEFETKHQYFWVQGFFYERRSNEWISYLTAKTFAFDGEPVLSPDGNHVFEHTTSDDPSTPSSIKIYAVTDENIKEVYRFDKKTNKKIAVELLQDATLFWVSSNEIALTRRTSIDGHDVRSAFARIVRENGKWIFTFDK